MPKNTSSLPDYMPRRDDAPMNIMDLLGGNKKWDVVFSDMLGIEFVCTAVDATKHNSKPAAVCTVNVDGDIKTMLLSSKVLAAQMLALQDELPLTCKIVRSGKRYRFTL